MKTFTSLALGISTLIAASAFAEAPAPELPTGACAGMLTKNSHVSFPASDSEVQNAEYLGVPHVTMYLDFDNSLAYMDGIRESGAELSEQEDRSSFELYREIDDGVMTVSVSETYAYGLEVNISYTLEDKADELDMLFVPTNGGTTFFVMVLDGHYKGVCQQI